MVEGQKSRDDSRAGGRYTVRGWACTGESSMEIPDWDGARTSVVLRLQGIAGRAVPGTETSEIADHAITLALSALRVETSPALLFRNVWRNSRHVLRRRRRRQILTIDSLDESTPLGRRLNSGELDDAVTARTPEDEAIAADLEQRIRVEVSRLNPRAVDCFDGLLFGETVEETAIRLHITPRHVKHVRSSIRRIVRMLAADSRAA
jgi:hypothetical protein